MLKSGDPDKLDVVQSFKYLLTSLDVDGTSDGTSTDNCRTSVKRNISLDFARATEGSFLSSVHISQSPICLV